MVELKKAAYPAVYLLYRTLEEFFPLIGAVLLDEQVGMVYGSNSTAPTQFYVEHKFGFAQIFGSPVLPFEAALQKYLMVDKEFAPAKVRLYTPHLPGFLQATQYDALRSERQRFILDPASDWLGNDHSLEPMASDIKISTVDQGNAAAIERQFGVVGRFWRSPEDFIRKALAVVAWVNEKPAAICYAAAVADGRAEIDVLTLPEYRHLGLGKRVVTLFNSHCLAQGVRPLWDCFTNNAGSMALCESSGFVPSHAAYPFFTINK